MAGATDAAAFLRANLPLVAVPGVPEIRLHLATPSSGLHRLLGRDAASPYWAYRWAGGLALARYLLEHPEAVAGKRVLDIGTGSGLVAIAAALAGAAAVRAVDVDPRAVAAARLNAAANGVAVAVETADLTVDAPPANIDLILAGDVFYNRNVAARVTAFLERCAATGIAILVGDPGRRNLPLARLQLLARYTVAETGEVATHPSTVFMFGLSGRT